MAWAATVGRVISNVLSAADAREPFCSRAFSSFASSFSSPPTTFPTGIRQSSRITSAVCDARMPSFFSFFPCFRPGVSGPTMNAACPRWPSFGSTVATTTCTLAMPPFVMNTFVPSRTHSSPSRFAVVRSPLTSDPAFGSVTQSAPTFGSSGVPNICGAHVKSWSGVPE